MTSQTEPNVTVSIEPTYDCAPETLKLERMHSCTSMTSHKRSGLEVPFIIAALGNHNASPDRVSGSPILKSRKES